MSLEDEDGDFDVPRSGADKLNQDLCLEIEHHLASTLDEVGCQVWRGSLVMADYLIQVGHLARCRSVKICS